MKKRVLSLLLCLVMALSLMPSMAFAESTPLAELRLYSTTTTVTAGTLPEFTASTSTEHVSVVEYGMNTHWAKRSASGDWNGFSGATPTAVNDGTHYGLCFCVETDNGYCLDSNTKLYFNDDEIANDINSLSTWSWGGYVYIDLGTATGEAVLHNVTFDTKGGSAGNTYIVEDGEKVNKPPFDPTRDGYTFDGWYEDESCTVPFDFASAITSDITVYAKWNETIKLAELRLYSTTTTVTAGTLPEFTASTSTEHASVVEYGMNTHWSKRSSGNDWIGFGGATPTAVNDGVTHYALCFCVNVESGYCLDSSTKLYFNDVEIANDIYSLSAWSWGGYVNVDLGTAACSHTGTVVTDKAVAATYAKTGKTAGTHCSACGKVLTAQKTVAMKKLAQAKITSITNTSTGITVKWGKVTGATAYQVYRRVGSGEWKLWKTTTSTSVSNSSLTNGTKYQYKVRAVVKNSAGTVINKGSFSAIKTMYRLTRPTLASGTKNIATRKIVVKWNKNTKVTGYQVKYIKGSTTKTVTVKGASSLTKTLSSLTKGATYKVYVRSYKTVSGVNYYSAWSAYKSVKVAK